MSRTGSTSSVRAIGSSLVAPLLGDRRRHRGAVRPPRTAAPTKRSYGCCTAVATKENIPDFIAGVKAGNERLMGFRSPRLQETTTAGAHHQAGLRRRLRGHRRQPAAGDRDRALRRSRSRTSTSSRAKLYPNVRLLLRADLRGARHADVDVPGDVRDRPHERLDRAVASTMVQDSEQKIGPSAPDLHRRARTGLCPARDAWLSGPAWAITSRAGSHVEREHLETLEAASLLSAASRGTRAGGLPEELQFMRRRDRTASGQVAARVEIAGDRAGGRGTVRGGVDLRGDGSAEAFTRARGDARVVECRRGESAVEALRRVLANLTTRTSIVPL